MGGRFISVDPLLDPDDPQQMNGYAYADNNPVTNSDPTGEICTNGPDGGCHKDDGTNVPTGGMSGPGGRASGDTPNNSGGGGRSGGGGGGGRSGGGDGGGRSGPSEDEQAAAAGVSVSDLQKAKKLKKKKVTDVIIQAGGHLLADMVGVTDINDCFTKGDIGACVSMLLDAIPWTKLHKIGSLIKSLKKAYRAFKKFLKDRKWATKVVDAAENACSIRAVGPSSFLPGTLVLMADGTRKPIEKIKPGDRVLATDPLTGRSSPRVVVAALTSAGVKHLVAVTVDTDGPPGDRTGTVTATDIHPFWVQDPIRRAGPNLRPGHWTNAEDLRVGDLLRSPDGTTHSVTATHAYTEIEQVHNLTTDTTHTYNVTLGGLAIIVHNSPCKPYEVGSYADLKAASKAGDGLDIHHVPQGRPASQVVPGYDYPNAPAIALPAAEHRRIPNLRGVYTGSSKDLIENDLQNLRDYTNTPESSVQQLTNLIDKTYPGAR